MSKETEIMRHAILDIDSGDVIGEIKFRIIDDGFNTTVFYPQTGHTISVNEEIYRVENIHHDYKSKVIIYGVRKFHTK
jgi:hypothetical protein